MIETKTAARPSKFRNMRLIPGGEFIMGSEIFYPEERPCRRVAVGDFWIDEAPVTNNDFAEFVSATGYVTFAERPIRAEDYPGMAPEFAPSGSFVFDPPAGAPLLPQRGTNPDWWAFVFGADWRHPLGPNSSLDGLQDHPVVHIVPGDAEAYAAWAQKSLPTECEWEFAALGSSKTSYPWGDEFLPEGRMMAKTWHGIFPHTNLAAPGLERTAPVRSYAANGYGLFDMIGNVWEWTSDRYDASVQPGCCGKPDQADLNVAGSRELPRVVKGGSHLCAPNYCQRYRPAARLPQAVDTPTSHTGFRCVIR